MNRIDRPIVTRKVARALTELEMETLLFCPGYSPPGRALLWLLADTGVRLGEALSVAWIDGRAGRMVVKGKTGGREVPVSPMVAQMVANALPWPWSSTSAAGRAIRKAFRKAGITGRRASAQTLRHTFTRMWRGDQSLLISIMGWTSPRMLEIYKPFDIGAATAQHQTFSPLVQILAPKQAIADIPASAVVPPCTRAAEAGLQPPLFILLD